MFSLASASVVLMVLARGPASAVVYTVALPIAVIAARHYGLGTATISGVTMMSWGVASVLGSPVAGLIADTLGDATAYGLECRAAGGRGRVAAVGGARPSVRSRAGPVAAVILSIDQGTTGTTCLVVDDRLEVVGRGYRELAQSFPQPGWVEHDPAEIWQAVLATAEAALADAGRDARDLRAIGITNQRETTVVWDRVTGRPLHPAIVWQDRRTAAACAALPAELIRERTGLVPDPYFSASKLRWLLDRVADDRISRSARSIAGWCGI